MTDPWWRAGHAALEAWLEGATWPIDHPTAPAWSWRIPPGTVFYPDPERIGAYRTRTPSGDALWSRCTPWQGGALRGAPATPPLPVIALTEGEAHTHVFVPSLLRVAIVGIQHRQTEPFRTAFRKLAWDVSLPQLERLATVIRLGGETAGKVTLRAMGV